MLTHRPAAHRGHANHGWLDSWHTFSFADYYDPAHMGFRHLRVINQDQVQPGQGFSTHSHQDMEIISFVISGALAHQDSMGNRSIIQPGEVQRMSAGTGVTHSEYNDSKQDPVHFLQIWILPAQKGIQPSYAQRSFTEQFQKTPLTLVVSPDGRDNSLSMNQDVSLYVGHLQAQESLTWQLPPERHAWVQMIKGQLTVNGQTLTVGDGAAITEESILTFKGFEPSQFLLFDLA